MNSRGFQKLPYVSELLLYFLLQFRSTLALPQLSFIKRKRTSSLEFRIIEQLFHQGLCFKIVNGVTSVILRIFQVICSLRTLRGLTLKFHQDKQFLTTQRHQENIQCQCIQANPHLGHSSENEEICEVQVSHTIRISQDPIMK